MCKECGCGCRERKGNTRLQFIAKGYTEELANKIEKELLGLAGVLSVNIHSDSGETLIDYDPAKTKLNELLTVFSQNNIEADI